MPVRLPPTWLAAMTLAITIAALGGSALGMAATSASAVPNPAASPDSSSHRAGDALGTADGPVAPPASTAADTTGRTDESSSEPPARTYERVVNAGISLVRKSDFAPAVQSDAWNLVWGLDDRIGYRTPDWSIRTGYTIHHARRYTLYDYGRLEVEYHPDVEAPWSFGLRAGGAYTRVNGKASGVNDIHAGYGLEAGAWLEGPWERVAYTYNSGAGGYHRFDLMLAGMAHRGGPELGTMYSVYVGDYVQMLRIGFYGQGWDGRGENIENPRPWPHKALAYAVLVVPFLPLTLLALLLGVHGA